jgi:hypothetical protein
VCMLWDVPNSANTLAPRRTDAVNLIVRQTPQFTSVKTRTIRTKKLVLDRRSQSSKVLGDLNLPDFDWELFLHPDSLLYNAAADLVCNHGLIQLVLEPTRANNILDIVLCSDDLSFDNVTCLPPLGSSDHNIISFSFTLSFPLPADNPLFLPVRISN